MASFFPLGRSFVQEDLRGSSVIGNEVPSQLPQVLPNITTRGRDAALAASISLIIIAMAIFGFFCPLVNMRRLVPALLAIFFLVAHNVYADPDQPFFLYACYALATIQIFEVSRQFAPRLSFDAFIILTSLWIVSLQLPATIIFPNVASIRHECTSAVLAVRLDVLGWFKSGWNIPFATADGVAKYVLGTVYGFTAEVVAWITSFLWFMLTPVFWAMNTISFVVTLSGALLSMLGVMSRNVYAWFAVLCALHFLLIGLEFLYERKKMEAGWLRPIFQAHTTMWETMLAMCHGILLHVAPFLGFEKNFTYPYVHKTVAVGSTSALVVGFVLGMRHSEVFRNFLIVLAMAFVVFLVAQVPTGLSLAVELEDAKSRADSAEEDYRKKLDEHNKVWDQDWAGLSKECDEKDARIDKLRDHIRDNNTTQFIPDLSREENIGTLDIIPTPESQDTTALEEEITSLKAAGDTKDGEINHLQRLVRDSANVAAATYQAELQSLKDKIAALESKTSVPIPPPSLPIPPPAPQPAVHHHQACISKIDELEAEVQALNLRSWTADSNLTSSNAEVDRLNRENKNFIEAGQNLESQLRLFQDASQKLAHHGEPIDNGEKLAKRIDEIEKHCNSQIAQLSTEKQDDRDLWQTEYHRMQLTYDALASEHTRLLESAAAAPPPPVDAAAVTKPLEDELFNRGAQVDQLSSDNNKIFNQLAQLQRGLDFFVSTTDVLLQEKQGQSERGIVGVMNKNFDAPSAFMGPVYLQMGDEMHNVYFHPMDDNGFWWVTATNADGHVGSVPLWDLDLLGINAANYEAGSNDDRPEADANGGSGGHNSSQDTSEMPTEPELSAHARVKKDYKLYLQSMHTALTVFGLEDWHTLLCYCDTAQADAIVAKAEASAFDVSKTFEMMVRHLRLKGYPIDDLSEAEDELAFERLEMEKKKIDKYDGFVRRFRSVQSGGTPDEDLRSFFRILSAMPNDVNPFVVKTVAKYKGQHIVKAFPSLIERLDHEYLLKNELYDNKEGFDSGVFFQDVMAIKKAIKANA